ncbi:MAG: CDP-2,3-bis-(O-geranylgeranyl)-sn-glycerol synthase [Methanomicrobiales archaeon]|nr:CDP-2,3-bis-(O-geranylgeranyl)-sn-glycerol synthase [Methanomicrobiales archaeon]
MGGIGISIYGIFLSFLFAFWVMTPAYVPNSAAAVFGGGRPIDGGRTWRDGRRMLGDGKTWRGLIGGVLVGILIGMLQILAEPYLGISVLTPSVVVCLAVGALLGDMAKSFVKRRLNKTRGEEWLIADQYDLVIGAFVLLLVFNTALVFLTITPMVLIGILILTPLLHRGANIIGYLIGVKDVPW